MRTIHIAATAANDISGDTLKAAPVRLLTFVQGAAEPVILAKLTTIGYSNARAQEGWDLLNELRALGAAPATASDPAKEATEACESWQSTALVRAREMMQLSHPEQASFIFHDFVSAPGAAAVLNAQTFLNRCAVLASGAERKGTRKADHDALSSLELAGMDKETMKELGKIVETAQTIDDGAVAIDPSDAKRTDALRRMYAWVAAWSNMARTVITRRDQLIRLGLAKRRATKSKAIVTPPVVIAPPVVTTPPVVTAPPVVITPPVVTPVPVPVVPAVISHEERSPDSRAA